MPKKITTKAESSINDLELNQEELAQWGQIKDQVMFDASVKKYKSCTVAKQVLKDTKNAELWHVVPRSKPVRFVHLEMIREKL